jgi:hypothetical protein
LLLHENDRPRIDHGFPLTLTAEKVKVQHALDRLLLIVEEDSLRLRAEELADLSRGHFCCCF